MTTKQISETIEDIYGFKVSEGMIPDITDRLLPEIEIGKAAVEIGYIDRNRSKQWLAPIFCYLLLHKEKFSILVLPKLS